MPENAVHLYVPNGIEAVQCKLQCESEQKLLQHTESPVLSTKCPVLNLDLQSFSTVYSRKQSRQQMAKIGTSAVSLI